MGILDSINLKQAIEQNSWKIYIYIFSSATCEWLYWKDALLNGGPAPPLFPKIQGKGMVWTNPRGNRAQALGESLIVLLL